MRRVLMLSLLTIAIAIVMACDAMAAGVAPPETGVLAELDRRMQGLVIEGRRAGVVYGVLHRGRLVTLRAHGWRDLERQLPMQTDSLFRIYSQTRAITSAAILTLVEQGRLDLDAPVERYLPAIGSMQVIRELRGAEVIATEPQRQPMTVRQLFNYTSGLGYAADWPAGVGINQREIMNLDGTLAQMVERLARYPLLYQPGERWVYGFHSDVLGAIAEVVSGQSFDELLRARLLDPLGLRDTRFYVEPEEANRIAVVYGPGPDGRLAARPAVPSSSYTKRDRLFSAGGGLLSSVPDYLRFGQMLLNGGELDGVRVLRERTVREMTRNELTIEQGVEVNWYRYAQDGLYRGYGWGLGIGVRLPGRVHTVPGSDGDLAWGGLASTAFFIDPKHQIVAVAMSQYLGPGTDDLGFALRDGVYAALVPPGTSAD